jgi:small subunit ribosomal protein S7
MARRREAAKRVVIPDPKFGDVTLAKFINMIMRDGKKSIAEHVIYGALDTIEERKKSDSREILEKALENVRPIVEVKSRRVGGATYQVPVEVRADRRTALAMRWSTRHVSAVKNPWACGWPARLWTPLKIAVQQLKNGKTPIAWRKRIKLLRTTVGKFVFYHYRY